VSATGAESGEPSASDYALVSKAAAKVRAGELFSGTKPSLAGQTIVFKSLGLAVEDIAAARLVYERLPHKA
jgi:ornithine cyclodeaminase/alanine dehydrogenase-like protein (mu-crystallin family)